MCQPTTMQNKATSTDLLTLDNRTYLNEIDKALLTSLVTERSALLQSKLAGARAVIERQKAWRALAEDFNASATRKRTVRQLKKCWANMKARAKRILSQGGDPSQGIVLSQSKRAVYMREARMRSRVVAALANPPPGEDTEILGVQAQCDLLPASTEEDEEEEEEEEFLNSAVLVECSMDVSPEEITAPSTDDSNQFAGSQTDSSYTESHEGRGKSEENKKSNSSRVNAAQGAVVEMHKYRHDVIVAGLRKEDERKAQLHKLELKKREMELEILQFQKEYWKKMSTSSSK